jgi:uncharacterized membrane protein
MSASTFLARLIGPVWAVLGVSLVINAKAYTEMSREFVANRALVYLAGAFALTGGLAIVLTHNVWVADWRIIITLFGWVATLAGVSRLLFPDVVRRLGPSLLASQKPILFTGIVWVVLGAVLIVFGYFR